MNNYNKVEGYIFNIQHYCIHDGPGIRTNVFLKGCPLSCLWCQNPESQDKKKQLFFISENCLGCGNCVNACPLGAIEIKKGKAKSNHNICNACGKCVEVCINEARSIVGELVTAEYVFRELEKDKLFYEGSDGGGVTITGGEPLYQANFAKSILMMCKDSNINTAIETCGFASWENAKEVIRNVDLVLYDIKHMNSTEHKKLTGVPNEIILENATKIYHELKKPIIIRAPIMPGYNDSNENIDLMGRFVANQLGLDVKVHLLPYHRLGESKNERLEKDSKFICIPPDEAHMKNLKEIIEKHKLEVQIGG